MDAPPADLSIESSTGYALARLGLIIPSSNRLSEPQLRRYLPTTIGLHVTRLQMTGRHQKALSQLLEEVGQAASALRDAKCDLVVFHCTANSMEHGTDGERALLEAVAAHAAVPAISTAQAVVQALRASAMRKYVLITPYDHSKNEQEIAYLAAQGFEAVHSVALNLPLSDGYIAAPPSQWVDVTLANQRQDADGYFLSCTNTTQIDAITALERQLGKPVVNSNQATIWACAKRLLPQAVGQWESAALGRLMQR